ncbi:ankyrin repeat domain-containing protein [Marinibacterium profundimaris]|uniref:Uncharacterized protein n=1 Tax=Marinibacterium profundimaris TaxID=1679460 RepID=A0A225NQM3_9RHOB|nr:ankyrin repeat domain-containing protein [Marinibacterium profundimaris]OWU73487.1 hypothetical protein ATO3_12550 [Marinibacterium profundimaris]
MTDSTQYLRRAAKALRKSFDAGAPEARARVHAVLPGATALRHADALHVIAREAGHDSWPRLKFAEEARALDRAARARQLGQALEQGRRWAIEALLSEDPALGRDTLALACATYDVAEVRRRLSRDPDAATRAVAGRRPIADLAFSRYHLCGGEEADMLAVAEALLAAGADVDDSIPAGDGSDHRLSVLYGAIGHGNNMALGEWLLDHGADPNDNESLYHATELGHRGGLRLLLAHGARPEGTNALLRALDFDDREAVALLLAAGADPAELPAGHPSGEPALVAGALHQAARRMCSGATAELLIAHGADLSARFFGHTAYALARMHGNGPVAGAIARAGGDTSLTAAEAQLARAADGTQGSRDWIDMALLSDEARRLLCRMAGRPGALPHMRRLVEMGFDTNATDEMGLTPLMLSGWEGLGEVFAFFLSQGPDLGHVNGFGGTLFETILHGSMNAPQRAARDHIDCMEQALRHGVALPRGALSIQGEAAMMAFLADWAERHPGQVVESPAA